MAAHLRSARHCFAAAGCIAACTLAALPGTAAAGILKHPIDPKQQTALAFGDRSHWLQPWRGYLDTPPATRLRDAIGINFNVGVEEAPATAQLLAHAGFRRARVELGWDQMSYDDPTHLANPGRLRQYVGALKAGRIRPLILLNANQGSPGPARSFSATLLEPARQGDRRVHLDPATASALVLHKTGLNRSGGRRRCHAPSASHSSRSPTTTRPASSAGTVPGRTPRSTTATYCVLPLPAPSWRVRGGGLRDESQPRQALSRRL